MALSNRQRFFVDEYLTCWNASEAARRAGYTSKSNVIGSQLLANPNISAVIEARLRESQASADEVLSKLTRHMRGSLAPFLRDDVVDLGTAEARANLDLLKSVKTRKRTGGQDEGAWTEVETSIEIHDPQAAAVHLGRHWALFIDKVASGEDVYREHLAKLRKTIEQDDDGAGDELQEAPAD